MNQVIEDAIVKNLLEVFPESNVFTENVVQEVGANDVIIKQFDEQVFILSANVRRRIPWIQVSFISPQMEMNELLDNIYKSLSSFDINGQEVLAEEIHTKDVNNIVHVQFRLDYRELI